MYSWPAPAWMRSVVVKPPIPAHSATNPGVSVCTAVWLAVVLGLYWAAIF